MKFVFFRFRRTKKMDSGDEGADEAMPALPPPPPPPPLPRIYGEAWCIYCCQKPFSYACYINMRTEHSFIDNYSTLLCVGYRFYSLLLSCACQLLINQYLIWSDLIKLRGFWQQQIHVCKSCTIRTSTENGFYLYQRVSLGYIMRPSWLAEKVHKQCVALLSALSGLVCSPINYPAAKLTKMFADDVFRQKMKSWLVLVTERENSVENLSIFAFVLAVIRWTLGGLYSNSGQRCHYCQFYG